MEPSLSSITQKLAEKFVRILSQASFDIYKAKEFRIWVNFENITETEQNRIFNELQVSGLGFLDLYLSYHKNDLSEDKQLLFSTLQKELPKSFLKTLSSLGIEQKFINIWQQLIKMRFNEFQKDYKLAINESNNWEEFKKDPDFQPIFARINTLTIDCLGHIRRGKMDEQDPLFKYLRKWFTLLEGTFSNLLHPDRLKRRPKES